MSKLSIIKTGLNFTEKIDDLTNKILCVTCGGKGFFLEIIVGETKGELVSCDCEQGFKYLKMGMKHGKKG